MPLDFIQLNLYEQSYLYSHNITASLQFSYHKQLGEQNKYEGDKLTGSVSHITSSLMVSSSLGIRALHILYNRNINYTSYT